MKHYPFTFATMVLSTSKKTTEQTNANSTLQTISHSKKKAALKKLKLQAVASLQSIVSTCGTLNADNAADRL